MNPEFTRDAYRGLDLEWFAVDRRGAIAILTTGYGLIPKAVFESEEQHRRCCEFFEAAAETSGARLATDLDPRGDYQLFLGEARRGFYSYFHSDFRPHEPYQLIAYPLTPLLLEELPEELQAALLRFRLGRVEFSRTDTLRMHEHFECE